MTRFKDVNPVGWVRETGKDSAPRELKVPSDCARFAPDRAYFARDGKGLTLFAVDHDQEGKAAQVAIRWELDRDSEGKRIALMDETGISPHDQVMSRSGRFAALPLDETIHLFDLTDGKEFAQIGKGFIDGLESYFFSSDEKLFLHTKGARTVLKGWAVPSGKLVRDIGNGDSYRTPGLVAHAFSPDGKTIAWCDGPSLSLIDIDTNQLLNPSGGHSRGVAAASFRTDGQEVITRAGDHRVIRWDPVNGRELGRQDFAGKKVTGRLTADGTRLVTPEADEGFGVRVLDLATMKELKAIHPGTKPEMFIWGLSADGRLVWFLTMSHPRFESDNNPAPPPDVVLLYDLATGEKRFEAKIPRKDENEGATPRWIKQSPWPLFFPAGRLFGLITAEGITIWHVASGRQVWRSSPAQTGTIREAVISPDGCSIALETNAGSEIWELATGRKRITLFSRVIPKVPEALDLLSLNVSDFFVALAFSADGRLFARAVDRVIRIWDLWTGKEIASFTVERGAMTCVAFAPDARRLVSGNTDSTAIVWDLAQQVGKLPSSWATVRATGEAQWQALIDVDASKAFAAMQTLAGDASAGVAVLRRVKRAERVNPTVIDKLITDLNDPSPQVRDKAQRELESLGDQAAPALRRAAANPPSAEVRQTARRLIESLTTLKLTREQVRAVRAVEVLERIGTADAVVVLKDLAPGADDVAPTPQAQSALRRLAARNPAAK